MKKKSFIYKLIVAFIAIFVALGGIELGIRLFLPSQRHLPMYHMDESGNHLLMPHLKLKYNQKEFSHDVITNSSGFRNKKELVNENLILFIGDSFTFGSGVDEEQHYSYIFDKLINWDEKKINVYNAGVPGYSTINQHIYIRDLVNRGLDIKKIFLGIDISDFNENLLFPIYDVQDGRLVFSTKEKKGPIIKTLNFLAGNSELVNFIYYRVVHSSFLKNYFADIFKLKYFNINLPDKNLQLFAKNKNSVAEKKLATFREYLIKIIELCRSHDIELYVYYIPTIQEIYSKNYEDTLKTYNLNADAFDMDFLNNYIKSVSLGHAARFIDIKKDMLKASDTSLYYLVDQHFNKYGNFIAGISLYKGYTNDKKQ